jgi:16S rRNA (guanine527-N7)-methyltransferase
VPVASTTRWLDLGSGGGLPGLVLAWQWEDWPGVLLDASQRRAALLSQIVAEMGWNERVGVECARAEDAAREPSCRASFSLVVARGFGPPAVTAECAAPFLVVGGLLVVSEPPGEDSDEARWPAAGLASLGLAARARWRGAFGYQILQMVTPCPTMYPRRSGMARKRPVF